MFFVMETGLFHRRYIFLVSRSMVHHLPDLGVHQRGETYDGAGGDRRAE